VPGKLSSQRYIYSDNDWGHLGPMNAVAANADTFTVVTTGEYDHDGFFAQYSEEYYLEPWEATVQVQGETDRIITGYHKVADGDDWIVTFTVDPPFSQSHIAGTTFRIKRGHLNDYKPCYFFKNGSKALEVWMVAFCAYLDGAIDFPHPVAVIVGTEDVGAVPVDWENYLHYWDDDRAVASAEEDPNDIENTGYTIDGVNNLRDWHTAFAPSSFTPLGPDWSPVNEELHSYLGATFITAYNYHREKSTWIPLREIWPDAKLSQYLIGDGYGVTYSGETEPRDVPVGPGESVYHGIPTWYAHVNWDAYNCVTNPRFPETFDPHSGGVIPIWQNSAVSTTGTADDGSTLNGLNEFPVQAFGLPHGEDSGPSFSPAYYLSNGMSVFIEFTDGPNDNLVVEATAYADGILTLTSNLTAPTDPGDPFIIYYPSYPAYVEYFQSDVPWPLIETFCAYYEEPVTAAGFLETGKKWAMEQARAQTRALPENPYTLTIGPGAYDGNPEVVSRWATYPNEPFTSKDGWLDGDDWGEVGAQAIDYGVNHFDWFIPGIVATGGTPHAQLADHLFTAMEAMHEHHRASRLRYRTVWCLADWNLDNVISFTDQSAFYQDYLDQHPDADLNGDMDFTEDDIDIFYNSGDCGLDHIVDCNANDRDDALDIAEGDADPQDEFPDLDTNDNGIIDLCEPCDADWDGDLEVGVPDIFAFLSDWMADTNGAKCYGGTCGVPAIFAFLSTWFSYGQNPCYE